MSHIAPLAGWQSGYAEDCKSLETGSIPVPASRFHLDFNYVGLAYPAKRSDDIGAYHLRVILFGIPVLHEDSDFVLGDGWLCKMKFAEQLGSLPEIVNFGIKASTVKQFLNTYGLATN